MITPITIASGTLIAQVCLLVIMAIGTLLLDRPYSGLHYRSPLSLPPHSATILTMALSTLGALVFSTAFTGAWSPLVGAMAPGGLSDSWALLAVVVIDVAGLSFLVSATGGSQQSPFQAIYFVLPTLAIFLRQSPGRVLGTSALVALSFSLCMRSIPHLDERRYGGERTNRLAYWFVSLASMALGLYIGLATRPT